MKFTSFDKLKLVISEFDANPVVANLDKHLTNKGISIKNNADQIVVGHSGIYYVDEKGALTKVIIHIVDKNVDSEYAIGLKDYIGKGDFESSFVLDKIHKYHLLKCNTIERAEAGGWREHRYRMSRRQDGYFFYRFLDGKKVPIKRDKQLLYVCKNCLGGLDKATGKTHERDTFNLGKFLSSSHKDLLNIEKDGEYANNCAPNIYQKDWANISKTYRELKKYQCENPNCPSPDLSEKKLTKYLHTHHVSFDKSNNNYSNLKSLCIYCHANQPNHSHMKQLPDYTDYKNYIKNKGAK